MNAPTINDYEGKTEHQRVLLRPGMYIGPVDQMPRHIWTLDIPTMSCVVVASVFPEGLERIFLEILSNSADNATKTAIAGIDPGSIDVYFEDSMVTIVNGGFTIPTGYRKDLFGNDITNPEFIFGTLGTGSNYKDENHVIGQNGIGAKATNIYSKFFQVEIFDAVDRIHYSMTWENNMYTRHEPIIEQYDGQVNKTIVRYSADLSRFGYHEYPPETVGLFARHVADISFSTKIKTSFNGVQFNLRHIRDMAKLYFPKMSVDNSLVFVSNGGERVSERDYKRIIDKDGSSLDIEVVLIDTPDAAMNVSYVNSLLTHNGGVHVDTVFKAVSEHILSRLNNTSEEKKSKTKKAKDGKVGAAAPKLTVKDLKMHMSLLVSVRVKKPVFDGQSKTLLKSPAPKFSVDPEEVKSVAHWGLMNRLLLELQAKEGKLLAKTDGKRGRFSAEYVGRHANGIYTHPMSNTLLIVEGKSALQYANKLVAAIPDGAEYIGTLPIRGKLLNVRNADALQIFANEELKQIKLALGLREGIDYCMDENYNDLNYGYISILTDADDDGKHICGLILNYLHFRFPTLLARGIVSYFRTPIVRYFKGKQVMKFYSLVDEEEWAKSTNLTGWQHKYYKGLATSLDEDIIEESQVKKMVSFAYEPEDDDVLDKVFNSKRANERKNWILSYVEARGIENVPILSIRDFLNYEFIRFSKYDVERSIPCIVDGLKQSQRKVVWAMFMKWKGKKMGYIKENPQEVKVNQLSAFTSEHTGYLHGEESLHATIAGMAQKFTGSNNMPYLLDNGQFGGRDGTKPGSPRYTHVEPHPMLKYLYHPDDFDVLEFELQEGEYREPKTTLPIIPMILVNGTTGIGTGWMSFVPQCHPLSLVNWLKCKLTNVILPNVKPWYRGFRGKIKHTLKLKEDDIGKWRGAKVEYRSGGGYGGVGISYEKPEPNEEYLLSADFVGTDKDKFTLKFTGLYENHGHKVRIIECPIGKKYEDYSNWFKSLLADKKVTDFIERPGEYIDMEVYGFPDPSMKTLHLVKSYGMGNMNLLDKDYKLTNYKTIQHVLEGFYELRLPYYQLRKDSLIKQLEELIQDLKDERDFYKAINEKRLIINKDTPDKEVLARIAELGLKDKFFKNAKIRSLGKDKVEKLEKKISEAESQIQVLRDRSIQEMWYIDLENFESEYQKYYGNDYVVFEDGLWVPMK